MPFNLSTHIPINHQPVTLEICKLVVSSHNLRPKISELSISKVNRDLTWRVDTSIAGFISRLLTDVLVALGLAQTINIQEGIIIHPDLLVVKNNSQPISVVETKTPADDAVMDHEQVHGQLYDYMHQLKEYFGLETVFGIATTYNQWRI